MSTRMHMGAESSSGSPRQRSRRRLATSSWLAVIALLLQLAASAWRPAMADPVQTGASAAIEELHVLFGPGFSLCRDSNMPLWPSHSRHDGCDECGICAHAGATAVLWPQGVFLPSLWTRYYAAEQVSRALEIPRLRLALSAQPRAPPLSL